MFVQPTLSIMQFLANLESLSLNDVRKTQIGGDIRLEILSYTTS